MLRKKLKLDEPSPAAGQPCVPIGEFSLSQFANVPKARLGASNVPAETGAKIQVNQTKPEPTTGTVAVPAMSSAGPLPYWQQVYQIERELSAALRQVALPWDVAACYDPIEYAAEIHCAYLQRFLDGPKPVLFIGMNPGPWGMCQTGVMIIIHSFICYSSPATG